MHIAQKFERLLEAHRRFDGSRWTGQQLDEATGGVVTRSYVTNLRKGRIGSPGYEKMAAIAKAMGFPPESWFKDGAGYEPVGESDDSRGIAGRVEHLFDAIRNPSTGEAYTNAEVARMTMGDLSEEDGLSGFVPRSDQPRRSPRGGAPAPLAWAAATASSASRRPLRGSKKFG